MPQATFPAYLSLWDQIKIWLMGRRHRGEVTQDQDEPCTFDVVCSCGGTAKFWRADDGDSVIIEATCPWFQAVLHKQRAAAKYLRAAGAKGVR